MADYLFEPTPHEEAAKRIADKPAVTRRVFDEMLPEIKGRVFTITGVEDAHVLQTVRDLIATVPQGSDWNKVKRDIANDISPFIDDDTKSEAENRAAAEARAELLLRVHGFQAYQATAYNMMRAQADVLPYWQYETVGDDKVRDSHRALDGKVFPANHPFWQKHFPPWDWGCRCQVVALSEAEVAAIRQADAKKNPEHRRVIEGAALQKAAQGTVLDGAGKPVSVAPRTGSGAFGWNPGDLRIPLDQLKSRYDADIWAAFESSMKKEKIEETGQSVWEWLGGASAKPESSLPVPAPAPSTAAPVFHAGDVLQEKAKQAGLAETVAQAARKTPATFSAEAASVKVEIGKTKTGHYNVLTKTITMRADPTKWNGRPELFHHEFGHHVHFERGIVTHTAIRAEFESAIAADLAKIHEVNEETGGGLNRIGDVWLPTVRARYGVTSAEYAASLDVRVRVLRLADAIGGASKGKLGGGHTRKYYQEHNHGAMEVFAQAYSAIVDRDAVFAQMFPNVVTFLKKEIGL